MSSKKRPGLAQIPILTGLSASALEHLQSRAQRRRYAPGDVVVREGDPARDMFLVLSGRLEVRKGPGVTLGELGPGDCLGEMALIDTKPRSATVQVVETAELMMLAEADFRSLQAVDPDAYTVAVENIARAVAGRLRRLNEAVEARNLWCVVY
jgi:CRP/FNR family transcriptional regulator, cyclic AMP receptor protein